MRTQSLLLVAGGLTLTAFLTTQREDDLAVRAPPPGPMGEPMPRGLYVRGGLALFLDDGRFQLDTPYYPASSSGSASTHDGQLVLQGISINMNCSFAVLGGHLWLGVLRRDRKGVFRSGNCEPLASKVDITWSLPTGEFTLERSGRRVTAPSTLVSDGQVFPQFALTDQFSVPAGGFQLHDDVVKTPWSVDLGPVGLLPVPGLSGVGTWTSLKGDQVTVTAGPVPPRPVSALPFGPTTEHALHWPPRADTVGYSSEAFPVDHLMGHGDADLGVTWVPLSVNEALRIVTGGCGADPRPQLQHFWRVLP